MHLKNHTFDEIKVGDRAEIRRLIAPDDLYIYAASSGNYNPVHLLNDDLDGDGVTEQSAPGMFFGSLISAVLGTQLPGPGTTYRQQTIDFLDYACAGDEVVCSVEVIEKQADDRVRLKTEVRRVRDHALLVSGNAVVSAPSFHFDREGVDVPGLIVEKHRHFEEIIARAKSLPRIPAAVVAPDEPNSLGGAIFAARENIIEPILVGRAAAIRATADEMGMDISDFETIDVPGSDVEAAAAACKLVHEGRAAAIMKGHLHTDDLLRPMLDKVAGLRIGRRFTHVFVMDVPGQAEPIIVTDAAINIAPDLATKVDICQNAIDLARSIGMSPRVGVLSAVEMVNPAIQSSIDAALLSKMADRKQIRGAPVEGPLAMDNAVNLAAARVKGLHGTVAGRANVLVVPDLDSGNMLAKQFTFISRAESAGLVLGAKVPVILNSRSDSAMSRLASCAVAALSNAYKGEE